MQTEYYFAYGSNMNIGVMAAYLKNTQAIGTATLKGYALEFRNHATISYRPGGTVNGVLWAVTPNEKRLLDVREGYPKYYKRKIVTVTVTFDDGNTQEIEAYTYYMVDGQKLKAPSVYYLNQILVGMRTHKIDIVQAFQGAIGLDPDNWKHVQRFA